LKAEAGWLLPEPLTCRATNGVAQLPPIGLTVQPGSTPGKKYATELFVTAKLWPVVALGAALVGAGVSVYHCAFAYGLGFELSRLSTCLVVLAV